MSTDSPPAAGTYKLCPRCHHIYPASVSFCARDGTELVADDRILAGKFLLLRQIGEGNMGAVWEAEQPAIGRTVAVKVLRADPEVMLRFEREVQASGALNHANVVTVFDSGLTEDGRGYIAMEYLDGESLGRHLDTHQSLPTQRALELWIPAVRAMAAAHGKGIVHRDLKPDNIFISRRHSDEGDETVVKVLDFGIAKFHRRANPAKGTTPGMIIGTMQYMSPEQLQGAEADPRADVYALGLILVEMLTGRLPWGATKDEGFKLFAVRMVTPPTPLAQMAPDGHFSKELQRLVADMLAMEPTARPANGGELLQRLKGVPEARGMLRPDSGSDSSISVAPAGRGGSTRGPTMVLDIRRKKGRGRRLRQLTKLLGIALGVLGVLGIVVLLAARRGANPPPAPLPAVAAPVKETPRPPLADVEKAAEPVAASPSGGKSGPHRATHAAPTLQVQFAFTDNKGVRLTCGGRGVSLGDCSGGGVCKSSVASVAGGQKCLAERGATRKTFTYADLQKSPADRKGLTHVFVHF